MADAGARDELSGLLGEVLDGKYRLDHLLGRGGMGVVYGATHLGTRRTVAVKVIAPRFLADAEFVERFRREAEAAGRMRHPNVVDVTDFGFGDVAGRRLAYLVMEYLDGCSLEDVLRQEVRLPLRWTADILEQACSAVGEAHRRGVVHRDLKPSNLWLEPDRRGGYKVKVLDFGLAKLADGFEAGVGPPRGSQSASPTTPTEPDSPTWTSVDGSPATPIPATGGTMIEEFETRAAPAEAASSATRDLTRVGATLGTPLYMSPEQCRGEGVGSQSDVYSLGVIAYRMLAGGTPFTGGEAEVMRQHLEVAPPPLNDRRVPKPVARLVLSALAKDPGQRPAGALAFGTAFGALAAGAGSLLRQSLTLLLEHPAPFLAIAAVALLPSLAFAPLLALAQPAPETPDPASGVRIFGLLCVLFLVLVAGLMSASAVCQPVVGQLLAAPLRPVELRPLREAFGKRLLAYARLLGAFALEYAAWALLPAILMVVLVPLLPPFLRWLIPVLVIGWLSGIATFLFRAQDRYAFAAGAILMEGHTGEAARRRSRDLAGHAKRELRGFEVVRALILLLGLFGLRNVALYVIESGTPARAALWLALTAPLYVPSTALFLIAVALLYFQARRAAGEPLSEALEQFEARALPAGYWQQQVRERIRRQLESSR